MDVLFRQVKTVEKVLCGLWLSEPLSKQYFWTTLVVEAEFVPGGYFNLLWCIVLFLFFGFLCKKKKKSVPRSSRIISNFLLTNGQFKIDVNKSLPSKTRLKRLDLGELHTSRILLFLDCVVNKFPASFAPHVQKDKTFSAIPIRCRLDCQKVKGRCYSPDIVSSLDATRPSSQLKVIVFLFFFFICQAYV